MTLQLTLYGAPVTKKNSQRLVVAGGRSMIIQSAAYKQYEQDCMKQIFGVARLNISHPVNVCCVYYMPTKRTVDLCNLLAATCDILVAAGVLEDDNSKIVISHDGSRVCFDRENPRVEIIITPAVADCEVSK